MRADRSGDRSRRLTFTVLAHGREMGTMTIWHNRYGAFAEYRDTRLYPLA